MHCEWFLDDLANAKPRVERLVRILIDELHPPAERPKLSPYRHEMKVRIGEILDLDALAVGLKFTTMEGVGAVGRGEAIACQAACLLAEADG